MSEGAVAERYAQAIFELAAETNELSSVSEQIRKVADVWAQSAELRGALENPVVDADQRARVLADVAARLGVRGTALNALQVMAARRRLAALPAIARQLTRLSDQQQGIIRASITSAQPLPESYYQSLVTKLEASTKKKVMLEKHQDASLIGGVVAKIGDSIIDGSIRGRLSALEKKLMAGGAS
jgi:F-type H+-transporting ATPase subunit delta